MSPFAILKKGLRRPQALLPGSVVSLGKPKLESAPEGDCLWRVCAIRHYEPYGTGGPQQENP